MWRSARRKLLKRREIAPYEGLFLGSAPLFELSFMLDGVGDPVEPLREHQCYRPTSCGVASEGSSIMLGNPHFQRGARHADVEASVRASQDIEKGPFIHFRSPIHRSHSSSPDERLALTEGAASSPRLEGCGHRRGLMVRD